MDDRFELTLIEYVAQSSLFRYQISQDKRLHTAVYGTDWVSRLSHLSLPMFLCVCVSLSVSQLQSLCDMTLLLRSYLSMIPQILNPAVGHRDTAISPQVCKALACK